MYALYERTGINTHDGYEYSVSESCQVKSITAEEYEAKKKNKNTFRNAYGMNQFASLCLELSRKTTDYYLVKCSQNSTESELDAYANGFLGIEGHFNIQAKCWNTV